MTEGEKMLRFPHGSVEPRRVFCIGRNYGDHISEMGGAPDDSCVVFMKPATSLVPAGDPVELPRGQGSVHHELEMVAAIGRGGKNIGRKTALSHVTGISLGIDLTLRDLQAGLKKGGKPWELSKAFDRSAPIGDFLEADPAGVEMRLLVNGELRQEGCTANMLFPLERLVEILSRTWELLPGDLIFTGTPAGVGPVEPGDAITVESPQIGRFEWACR
jgi:2-keto-4-pentenoate hydratase/2-oxohepta-3-ene-1,7-dioic acid hydratase in catechol pathway